MKLEIKLTIVEKNLYQIVNRCLVILVNLNVISNKCFSLVEIRLLIIVYIAQLSIKG